MIYFGSIGPPIIIQCHKNERH